MSARLVRIACALLVAGALVPLATLPAAAVKRTAVQKKADFDTCTSNGGAMAVCCIAAGGDYTPPHSATTANGFPATIESCSIAGDEIVNKIINGRHIRVPAKVIAPAG